jgi:hypothetical protein
MKQEEIEIVGMGTFIVVLLVVGFVFAFGVVTGLVLNEDNDRYLTEKVQDQFWEIKDLETELAVCQYDLGNEQSIVLNSVFVPVRR